MRRLNAERPGPLQRFRRGMAGAVRRIARLIPLPLQFLYALGTQAVASVCSFLVLGVMVILPALFLAVLFVDEAPTGDTDVYLGIIMLPLMALALAFGATAASSLAIFVLRLLSKWTRWLYLSIPALFVVMLWMATRTGNGSLSGLLFLTAIPYFIQMVFLAFADGAFVTVRAIVCGCVRLILGRFAARHRRLELPFEKLSSVRTITWHH